MRAVASTPIRKISSASTSVVVASSTARSPSPSRAIRSASPASAARARHSASVVSRAAIGTTGPSELGPQCATFGTPSLSCQVTRWVAGVTSASGQGRMNDVRYRC